MIVEKAYLELYPDSRLGEYSFYLEYSAKFNHYNANVKKMGRKLVFNLSKEWESIDESVQIGLIQSLMNRIFNTKVYTQNMDLYEIFLKKVHIAVPKIYNDKFLEDSFNRVNDSYFNGTIERPNLKWGTNSIRKLGSYEYGSDTITISKVFKDSDPELLDYIMYHEMLHKKHKFHTKNGKSYHHTGNFRRDERKFDNQKEIEKKINSLVRKKRRKKLFGF